MDKAVPKSAERASVAMATYNGARFIREQLDSLARQTLLPLELVITDDGSTDDTWEIVEQFALEADFPVRFFQNEGRLGYAENFLRAASLCSGPLVAFCDQDDCWGEDKLASCVPYFSDASVMMTCHSAALWDGETLTGGYYPHFERTEIHPPVSTDPFLLVPGFTIVFRKSLLDLKNGRGLRHPLNLGQTPEPMAHDAWVIFLSASLGRVVTIRDSLALYRQHGKNAKGAPEETSAKSGILLAMANTGYDEMASLEEECADAAAELAAGVPLEFSRNVIATSKNFRDRSRFHRLRSAIYDPERNVVQRSLSFFRLMLGGAYFSDTTKTRLGPRAAVKDLLFGVSALSRLKKSA